jgi:hypothetical protein
MTGMRRRLAMLVALVAAASCLPVGGPPPSLPLVPTAAVTAAADLTRSPWAVDVARAHPVRTARPAPAHPAVAAHPVRPHPAAAAKPAAPRPTAHRSQPKPLVLVPTGGAVKCYVGKPCVIPPTAWHVTHGCTKAWRLATHQDCPPGYPPLP